MEWSHQGWIRFSYGSIFIYQYLFFFPQINSQLYIFFSLQVFDSPHLFFFPLHRLSLCLMTSVRNSLTNSTCMSCRARFHQTSVRLTPLWPSRSASVWIHSLTRWNAHSKSSISVSRWASSFSPIYILMIALIISAATSSHFTTRVLFMHYSTL